MSLTVREIFDRPNVRVHEGMNRAVFRLASYFDATLDALANESLFDLHGEQAEILNSRIDVHVKDEWNSDNRGRWGYLEAVYIDGHHVGIVHETLDGDNVVAVAVTDVPALEELTSEFRKLLRNRAPNIPVTKYGMGDDVSEVLNLEAAPAPSP